MASYPTRRKGSNDKWVDAVWYKDYFGGGEHGVRFRGKIEILRGSKYEITKGTIKRHE